MSQLVTINHATLEQLLYKNVPVVTIQQIADVHGISVKNVHGSFQRHLVHFVEGKHFYRLDFAEASQLLTKEEANPNGLLLFTRQGYLLLTKPLRDDTAWDVQERMIDEYFVLREGYAPLPALHDPTAQALVKLLIEQDTMKHELAVMRQQVDTIIARQPPQGKMTLVDWLKRYSKPYLPTTLMDVFKYECRRLEAPEMFQVDGMRNAWAYYSPYTLATAYETATRQLSFIQEAREDTGYAVGRRGRRS